MVYYRDSVFLFIRKGWIWLCLILGAPQIGGFPLDAPYNTPPKKRFPQSKTRQMGQNQGQKSIKGRHKGMPLGVSLVRFGNVFHLTSAGPVRRNLGVATPRSWKLASCCVPPRLGGTRRPVVGGFAPEALYLSLALCPKPIATHPLVLLAPLSLYFGVPQDVGSRFMQTSTFIPEECVIIQGAGFCPFSKS